MPEDALNTAEPISKLRHVCKLYTLFSNISNSIGEMYAQNTTIRKSTSRLTESGIYCIGRVKPTDYRQSNGLRRHTRNPTAIRRSREANREIYVFSPTAEDWLLARPLLLELDYAKRFKLTEVAMDLPVVAVDSLG